MFKKGGPMQAHDPRNTKFDSGPRNLTIAGRSLERILRTPLWRALCWLGLATAFATYIASLVFGKCEAQVLAGLAIGLMIGVLYSDAAGPAD